MTITVVFTDYYDGFFIQGNTFPFQLPEGEDIQLAIKPERGPEGRPQIHIAILRYLRPPIRRKELRSARNALIQLSKKLED